LQQNRPTPTFALRLEHSSVTSRANALEAACVVLAFAFRRANRELVALVDIFKKKTVAIRKKGLLTLSACVGESKLETSGLSAHSVLSHHLTQWFPTCGTSTME